MHELMELLECGKSPYHAAAYALEKLQQAGYRELEYTQEWKLSSGGKYFVRPYAGTVIAFAVPERLSRDTRAKIILAHTDFPCFKIKPKAAMINKGYHQLNIEPYGGMKKGTWFDRPLGICGKVVLQSGDAYHPKVKLFESQHALAVIPSLAPHMEKGTEQKKEYDVQQELMPVTGMMQQPEDADELVHYLAEQLQVKASEILDYDLFLANMDKPLEIGMDAAMVSAPRIDNLASVSAVLEAMQQTDSANSLIVAGLFDNEEIGSRSKQGADSMLLPLVLKKAGNALGTAEDVMQDILADGFLLSVDGAQATHPNYVNQSDITNDVVFGAGLVIKTSASQRYLSDAEASAVISSLCIQNGIAFQKQVNRSGMPGGQTLGPIAVSYLPMLGADIGIPMLAMHSARELAYRTDYESLTEFLRVFLQD